MLHLFFAIWVLLFMTGCGGGGGRGTRIAMPPLPPVVVPTPERNAVRDSANAIPNFGSVTQSSNVNSTNVTFDTARASFDGTNGQVTITHQDSSTTTLDTTVDSIIRDSTELPSPIR